MNTKERVIQFLLSTEREYKENGLQVTISRNKYNSSEINDIGEDDFINILSILETEKFIYVNFPTGHKNLQYSITVKLYEPIINYFNNKRETRRIERNQWIQFWVPVSLSVIALIISIIGLILKL